MERHILNINIIQGHFFIEGRNHPICISNLSLFGIEVIIHLIPFPLLSTTMTSDVRCVQEDDENNENNVMMTFDWFSDLP